MKIDKFLLFATAVALSAAVIGCSGNGTDGNKNKGASPTAVEPTASPSPSAGGGAAPSASPQHTQLPSADQFDYTKLSGYEAVAEGLKVPWAIAAVGETIYISERDGNIVKLEKGKLVRQRVKLDINVKQTGESGFLGFVLDPDFSSNRKAYVYHTYESGGQMLNRIVKLKEEGDEWTETAVLLEGIPGARYHDGGRLAIGPDGNLYATTGDAQKPELAQDKNSLAGKILRMSLEGNVPADNPFPGSYVFSYGHRNPQGLAWDASGRLFETEHGPSGNPGGHDELNLIEAGSNYGWPDIIGDAAKDGMKQPLYHSGAKAIAPSGAVIDGSGQLLFTTLVGETLYRYDTVNGGVPEPVLQGVGRLRDVMILDGRIYVITNNTDGRGTPLKTDDRLLILKFDQ